MNITEELHTNFMVIIPNGEINIYNASILKEYLQKIMKDKDVNVALDMSAVSYIDSSGIGTLIASKQLFLKTQRSFKLFNLSESIYKILQLTKLDSFFDIYIDHDALASSY